MQVHYIDFKLSKKEACIAQGISFLSQSLEACVKEIPVSFFWSVAGCIPPQIYQKCWSRRKANENFYIEQENKSFK